ncbi:ABC transporter substrate-binding protein [Nocardioides islandensis]|jgi:peptide/nickel transport system substrate-binding protein|uniref:ABC transporter substrate-binding protein n=1 Tax=Nocardioides islandensis TaxID=433663 RepID=A0A930V9Q9_9ACTN|nr:ABC transporter substrate-binding protein [Nocardioides islandensis]MBF4761626.1 ABC transporter substrate-binding protein [Nocardioides islandensis]
MKIAPPNPLNMAGAVDLNRRKFLQITSLGLAVVTTGGLLTACGSDGSSSSPSSGGASGAPKKGGTLRVGSTGGGTTDTLDPQAWATLPDQLRVQQLYDPLVWMAADGTPTMVLAKEITPNADGTEWTITIQSGVTTHNGKPFTAEDVLFSFQRILDNKYPGAFLLGPIDMKASKAVDDTTAKVVFSKPFGILMNNLSFPYFYMVPRGFDPAKPDGTGPFKFKSFTAGEESTFVRNENYWQSGLPYLDEIVIQNITDESSQLSAFQSGQVDIVNALSAGSVAALKSGGYNVKINESGNWVPFTMNCQAEPFSDVRVRQAFRLIPNRQQMLDQVFGGYGKVGNDVFSPYDAGFPSDLPQREQDLDQAKSLLKAAGYSDLSIKLTTAPAAAGEVNMAQVFATAAKGAGINVQVDEHDVGTFYSNYYLKVPFGTDYGTNQSFLANASQLMIGDNSFYNANHFDDPEYTQLYDQAVTSVDDTERNRIIGEMAHIDYERGGYIVPVFSPTIEAYTPKVGGISDYITGVSPNNADFKNMWLAS